MTDIYEMKALMLSRKRCSDGTTVLEFQVSTSDEEQMYPNATPGESIMLDYRWVEGEER